MPNDTDLDQLPPGASLEGPAEVRVPKGLRPLDPEQESAFQLTTKGPRTPKGLMPISPENMEKHGLTEHQSPATKQFHKAAQWAFTPLVSEPSEETKLKIASTFTGSTPEKVAKEHPIALGITEGITDLGRGLTSPFSIATIAGGPLLGTTGGLVGMSPTAVQVVSRTLSALFAAQAAYGTYKDAGAAYEAYQQGNNRAAARAATGAVFSLGAAAFAGTHAARGGYEFTKGRLKEKLPGYEEEIKIPGRGAEVPEPGGPGGPGAPPGAPPAPAPPSVREGKKTYTLEELGLFPTTEPTAQAEFDPQWAHKAAVKAEMEAGKLPQADPRLPAAQKAAADAWQAFEDIVAGKRENNPGAAEKPEAASTKATGPRVLETPVGAAGTLPETGKATVTQELEPPTTQDQQPATPHLDAIVDRVNRHAETEAQLRSDLKDTNIPPEDYPAVIAAIQQQGIDAYAKGDIKGALEAAHHEILMERIAKEGPPASAVPPPVAPEAPAASVPTPPLVPAVPVPKQPETPAPPAVPGYVAGVATKIGKGKKPSVSAVIAGFMKRAAMEAQGQGILDEMIENKENPSEIEKTFWNDTYFKLPGNVQKRFQQILKGVSGMQPGDYIGNDKDGNSHTAKTWMDIANHPTFGTHLGDDAQYLEGADRGYAVLMREANRALAGVPSKTQGGTVMPPAPQLPAPVPPPVAPEAPAPAPPQEPETGIGKYSISEVRAFLEQAAEYMRNDPTTTPNDLAQIERWLKLPDYELLNSVRREGTTEQDITEGLEEIAKAKAAPKPALTPEAPPASPAAPAGIGKYPIKDVRAIIEAQAKQPGATAKIYADWLKLPDHELVEKLRDTGIDESLLDYIVSEYGQKWGLQLTTQVTALPELPVPQVAPPTPSPAPGPLPAPRSPELQAALTAAGLNDPATMRVIGRALQGTINSKEQLDQVLQIAKTIKAMDPNGTNSAAAIEAIQYGGMPGLENTAAYNDPDANMGDIIERAKKVLDAVRKPPKVIKQPKLPKAGKKPLPLLQRWSVYDTTTGIPVQQFDSEGEAKRFIADSHKTWLDAMPYKPDKQKWEVFDHKDGKPIATYDSEELAKGHVKNGSGDLDYAPAGKHADGSSFDVAFARGEQLPTVGGVQRGYVEFGADASATAQVLSTSVYKGTPTAVVTKELLQNAWDSFIKPFKGDVKDITVEFDDYDQTITVTDTGIGMSRDQMETVLTDIGKGSNKRESKEAAGGFAIAKAAIFLKPDHVTVTSIYRGKDGKLYKSVLATTPEQLLATPSRALLTTEVVADDAGFTTGTMVETVFNDTRWAEVYHAKQFAKRSELSIRPPAHITIKGADAFEEPQEPLRPNAVAKFDITGAKVDVYRSDAERTAGKGDKIEVQVNNNGIFQFIHTMSAKEGVDTPKRVVINVKATVKETHDDYPFSASREEFRSYYSGSTLEGVIEREILGKAIKEHNKNVAEALRSLPSINVGATSMPIWDSGKRMTAEETESLQGDSAFVDLAYTINKVARDAIAKLGSAPDADYGVRGLGQQVKKIGILFQDKVWGVHVPIPDDDPYAYIFINPFYSGKGNPRRSASMIWHTIKHELIHEIIKDHYESFSSTELLVAAALESNVEMAAIQELEDALTSPDDPGRIRADLDHALQLYAESRERDEVTPDIFRGKRLRGGLPGLRNEGVRDSREGTVSGDEHGSDILSDLEHSERFSPNDPMTRTERSTWFRQKVAENMQAVRDQLEPYHAAERQAIKELGPDAKPGAVAARIWELAGVDNPWRVIDEATGLSILANFETGGTDRPRSPMPMPPGTVPRPRSNVALREILPGAREYQEKRYKNWVETERMKAEQLIADKDHADLINAKAELGHNPSLATIHQLNQELDSLNRRRKGIDSYRRQLKDETEALDTGLDPNVGEVRLDGNGNPTIYLNKTAMQMIRNVIRPGQTDTLLKGQAMSVGEARWLKNKIITGGASNGDEQKIYPSLMRLLDTAVARSRNGITVVGRTGQGTHSAIDTLREELIHRWQQMRSANGRFGTHLSDDAFLRLHHEMPRSAYDYLRENKYEGDTAREEAQIHVVEAAAKIMAGKWRRMGLTKPEAVNWLARYYEEVAGHHGVQAVLEVEHTYGVAREFQKELERIYGPERSATGTATGQAADTRPGRSLSSVERGRQGETGGDAAGRAGRGIDTPEFKAWFGDSKIVDDGGLPMMVYHGTRTPEDFSEFSVEGPPLREDDPYEEESYDTGSGADPTSYLGAHFAKESSVANQFAQGYGWMKTRFQSDQPKPRVIPAYLSIKTPKDFGSEQNLRNFIYQGKPTGYAADAMIEEAMRSDELDPDDFDDPKVEEWSQKYENDPAFRRQQNRWIIESKGTTGENDDLEREFAQDLARQAKQRLVEQGHDGVIYKNIVEGGTSYVAFEPTQIKSAIGNTGKYDPENPDILANVEKQPPEDRMKAEPLVSNEQLDKWSQYWRSRGFKSEQELRDFFHRYLESDDKQYGGFLHKTRGPEKNRAIADWLPTYKDRREFKIGRKPKPDPVSKERLGSADPEGKSPNVDFYKKDLQDSGPVTEGSILRDYNFPRNRKAIAYKTYVPISDVPDPILAEEDESIPEEDRGTYSWEDFHIGDRSFPPAKLLVQPNGKVQIQDGNHRIKYWQERGYDSIPAWVIDQRRGVKLEPEDEEDNILLDSEKRKPQLAAAIDKANSRYELLTPHEIAHGNCYEWALAVAKNLPGSEVKDVDLWPHRGKDALPYHVWVDYQGKSYDAETPNGVANWKQLPYFREHVNQAILPKLKARTFPKRDEEDGSGILNNMEKTDSSDERNKAFDAIADQQRYHHDGDAEDAMEAAQLAAGGGVWSDALEHVGDLLHRMTEKTSQRSQVYGDTQFGYGNVKDKVERKLWSLQREPGYMPFEQEFNDNLRNNHESRQEDGKIPANLSLGDWKQQVFAVGEKYSQEHEKLPVYNRMQWLARQAAIDLGRRNFKEAERSLAELKRNLDKGKDHWKKVAGEYDPHYGDDEEDGNGILSDMEKTGDADDKQRLSDEHAAPEPGSLPIPPKTVRLFHYTHGTEHLPAIREQGLLKAKGRGDDLSGGGPSAGIWASTEKPSTSDLRQRPYVEFYATADEISHNANYPDNWKKNPETGSYEKKETIDQEMLDEWAGGTKHVIMRSDVPTSQILAIHEPWMDQARSLQERWNDPGMEHMHDPKELDNWQGDAWRDIRRAIEYVQKENSR